MKLIATKPQIEILKSESPINLFLSGQGSGKTFCSGVVAFMKISQYPGCVGIVCANSHEQLTKSTLRRVFEVWKSFGLVEYNQKSKQGDYTVGCIPPENFDTSKHSYKNYENIISFKNGSVIFTGSLERYKLLDGIEVDFCVIDEVKDARPSAIFDVILGRLRGKVLPQCQLYLFTSPAKSQWLNEWFELDNYIAEITSNIYLPDKFFKKQIDNKFIVISSTHHNAHNLPKKYIENQMKSLHSGLVDMLIYGNPFSKSGGEFYHQFDRAKHVGTCEYNPDLPVHASFDFNVNPYVTCIITQIQDKSIFILDEICSSWPDNSTPKTAQKLKLWLDNHNHNSGVFIYGDPSGKSADTRSEPGSNDFKLIKNVLKEYNPIERLLNIAPRVTVRGNFINSIFEKELMGISIKIDPKCVNTINDFVYLKQSPDGSKFKERVQNPETKQFYEKLAHCSDAIDYEICSAFRQEFSDYQKGKTRVKGIGASVGIQLGYDSGQQGMSYEPMQYGDRPSNNVW